MRIAAVLLLSFGTVSAGDIAGTIRLTGPVADSTVTIEWLGADARGQAIHGLAGMGAPTPSLSAQEVTNGRDPGKTTIAWDEKQGLRYRITALPPGHYLVWVLNEAKDVAHEDFAWVGGPKCRTAWRWVEVHGGKAEESVEFAIDPEADAKAAGSLKVTVPDELWKKMIAYGNRSIAFIPEDADGHVPLPDDVDVPFYLDTKVNVEAGPVAQVKSLPPGRYRVDYGVLRSEAEVKPGQEAAVEVRLPPEMQPPK